jgi:NADH dehydrogenase [ubiquinone] 1 alpha subcomplex assembly factor 1
MRAVRLALLSAVTVTLMTSCADESTPATQPATTLEPTSTTSPTTTTKSIAGDIIVSFPDEASISPWRNIDDSVMGGVSASTSTWQDGALVFTGTLSTANNGGFSSIFAPVDRTLGTRSAGATAFGIDAVGDGRTYVLQLRAGASGDNCWISRFTPPVVDDRTLGDIVLPISSFEPVDRFLRPTNSSQPLDPATIIQIGVYVLDGQVGEFQLTLRSISAVR